MQRRAYNFYRLRPRMVRGIDSWNGMFIPMEYSNGLAIDGARGVRPPPEQATPRVILIILIRFQLKYICCH
jgi:hypothetical protein